MRAPFVVFAMVVLSVASAAAQAPVGGAQGQAPIPPDLAQFNAIAKATAALVTCSGIIVGGLWVFYRRANRPEDFWGQLSIQTLGTIFFFPTLIMLGVFLELDKAAITTILGAFIGYLFGRGSSTPSPTPLPPPRPEGAPAPRPQSPSVNGEAAVAGRPPSSEEPERPQAVLR